MSKRPSLFVAIDTMVLIWGTRKKGQAELLRRTETLFKILKRDGATIMLPSVVVAEYLTHVKPSDQSRALAEIAQSFFIAPFDAKCAKLVSELYLEGSSQRKKGQPQSRVTLRADTLIVATAKTFGARRFYSHDNNCRKLAEKAKLEAFDLPMMDEVLFES